MLDQPRKAWGVGVRRWTRRERGLDGNVSQRTLRQSRGCRRLGQSLDYACSRQDWHGNTVDGHANFLGGFLQGAVKLLVDLVQALTELAPSLCDGPVRLGPRLLSGPERVAMGSIGSPKLHSEWAEVRGIADPDVAGCREPRKHHDQENEK